jgi:hypothetical protein
VIPKGARGQEFKGSPMAGSSFHYDNRKAKELHRFESLAKVRRTLFRDMLIKSLENIHLNPGPSSPTKLEKNLELLLIHKGN